MTNSTRRVGAIAAGAVVAAAMLLATAWAQAQVDGDPPDLILRKDVSADAKIEPPAAVVTTTPEDGFAGEVPWGFYRDRQGRIMQVSFDFGRRLWLGVRFAPHRTAAGADGALAGAVHL